MNSVFGFDVSKWQDDNRTPQQIDFRKMKAYGASFVIIRYGIDESLDEDVAYNYREAGNAGLLRGAYWFHNYSKPAGKQITKFIETLKAMPPEIRGALDLEEYSGYGALPARDTLIGIMRDYKTAIKSAFGYNPMLYCNRSFIRYSLGSVPSDLLEMPLWLAQWGVEANNPTPWPFADFWQTGTPAIGLQAGVESSEIDFNYWRGTLAELYKFCNLTPPTQPTGDYVTRKEFDDLLARLRAGYQAMADEME